MKTPFSSVVSPLPNSVAKRFVGVNLFLTLKRGEGRLPFRREKKEVGNFHVSQQLLSMIVEYDVLLFD